jgi:hypothetical protein
MILDSVCDDYLISFQSDLVRVSLIFLSHNFSAVKSTTAKFLAKLIELSGHTTVFSELGDLTVDAILRADDYIWKEFKRDLLLADDNLPIVRLLLAHIETSQHAADLFVALVPKCQIDTQDIFPRSIKLILSPDKSIALAACGVAISTSDAVAISEADFQKILELVSQTSDREIQDRLYQLCSKIASQDQRRRQQMQQFLMDFVSISFDRWSYDPSRFAQRNFRGLSNLGATCYMNAIL